MLYLHRAVQLTNTVVFFFAGAASVNFFIRSAADLNAGASPSLAATLARLPLIFVAMLVVRAFLLAAFSPMLNLVSAKMDWRVRP